MNIGFDAKRAFNNGTGLGHYSRTLLSSLATYFPQYQYVLFAPEQTNRFNTADFANMRTVTPSQFPSTLFKGIWRGNWVKKDLLANNIDIYHGLSHEIPVGIQQTRIRTVVTMHDLIFERYPQHYNPLDVYIYRTKFRYACKHADKVIAISQQTKSDLIEFYKTPEEKIEVCYQSCHPAFAKTVSKEAKSTIQKFYQLPANFFLYVGSIIERKNLLTICKALPLLKGKLDLPLVVIGNGGKYKEHVKAYLRASGLESQVIFLSEKFSNSSFKSAEDFPAIYQLATALIYPSIFEGFGIPILEALWSKTPVITSNVSCMPETGGDAAFYINPASEEAMANAMLKVTTDNELRKAMIEKGWQHAHHFTQEACAASVMKVYEQLL
jgi:glycosyltransferase involved in cell wall biosynthesis